MNDYLAPIDWASDNPSKLDHGATGHYWLLTMLIISGTVTVVTRPHLQVEFLGVWLFAIVWMVTRTLRPQLDPALLQGKGENNRWLIGLDLWSIDISILLGLLMMLCLVAYRFRFDLSPLIVLPTLLRNFLVPLIAIPLLQHWVVSHKLKPAISDWDREFVA